MGQPQQQQNSASAWTPVDESASAWTPVDEQEPQRGFLANLADKLPGSADTGLKGAVNHLGDTWDAVGKPIADVSAPVIAGQLYKKFTGQPNEVKELPGKMVTAFALSGEPEGDIEAGARPKVDATPEAASEPGMLSRTWEVAKRRAGHIPGVQAVKDINYVVRGEGGPPTPPGPPAPSVPDFYGKGQYGTPVDQWGSRIPQAENPGAPLPEMPPMEVRQAAALYRGAQQVHDPAAGLGQIPVRGSIAKSMNQSQPAPVQRGSLRQMIDDIGTGIEKGTGASPPPNPKAPIYQRGTLAQPTQEGTSSVLEGHTPVNSSWIKSYKYDPTTREFEMAPKSGTPVRLGDVSPEEAQAFGEAKSQGKAWQQIKNNVLVAKRINGRWVAAKPASQ